MKISDGFGLAWVLLIGSVILTLTVGWVMNIMTVWNLASAGGDITAMFVLRIAGIFVAPVGGILGWL